MVSKALYVDDEPDICRIAEMCLQLNEAFETRSAGSGLEAIDIARSWQPDVILLDVMMPGLDGPSTFGHLKADPLTAQIPVIFVTAKALESDLARLKSHDILGVIPKPFQAMTLAEEVRELMNRTG
ncbi:response regulator [Roseibium aestuarii]|uniref:Response regulator n=1 Tax=Roseibium aestuarii TaxID=2600299 RepID=A0ABW4K093_9HYPH|nr:response regulator [Roseibium aestuarii]